MSISVTNILVVTGSSKAPAMHGAYGSHLREALEYRSTVSMSDWLRFPPPGNVQLPTGITVNTLYARKGIDASHAPKIVRRCEPIRGDEQPAAVLLHPSTAQARTHNNAMTSGYDANKPTIKAPRKCIE